MLNNIVRDGLIFVCVCRGPYAFAATDWLGYDCQHAACPTGEDPTLVASRLSKKHTAVAKWTCTMNI